MPYNQINSTSLSLLPSPLRHDVVVIARVPPVDQNTMYKQMTGVRVIPCSQYFKPFVCKQTSSGLFKISPTIYSFTNHIYLMHKINLALNKPQRLICHTNQPLFLFIWNHRALCKLFIFRRNTWKIELLTLDTNICIYLTMCKQNKPSRQEL